MPASTSTFKDYYGTLGLSKAATYEEIKGAYKSLALKWHPDRHETKKEDAARKFIEINEAYRFLSDQGRRHWYDNMSTEKSRGRHGSKPTTTTNSTFSTKTPKPQEPLKAEEPLPSASGGLKVPTFPSTKARSDPGLRDAPNKSEGLKVPGGPSSHPATSEAGLHEYANKKDTFSSPHRPSLRAKSEANRAPAAEDPAPPPAESKTRPKSSGGKLEADLKDFIRRMSGGNKKSPRESPSFSSRKAKVYDDEDDEEQVPLQDSRGELHTTTHPSTEIPDEWIFPLPLTLEELYEGASHRYRITRHLLSGKKKDIMVDIDVASGWKKGTKIRFTGAGNEREGNTPQDVVFVVEEVPHQTFVREGSTLITRVEISLFEALADEGRRLQFTGIDGKLFSIEIPPEIIRPGDELVIEGAGMPIRKHGKIVGRGDMVVRWEIQFPQKLTKEQQKDLEKALKH